MEELLFSRSRQIDFNGAKILVLHTRRLRLSFIPTSEDGKKFPDGIVGDYAVHETEDSERMILLKLSAWTMGRYNSKSFENLKIIEDLNAYCFDFNDVAEIWGISRVVSQEPKR